MKTGRTIQELAAEIARQSETKHDYVAKTGVMEVMPTIDNKVALVLQDKGAFPIGDIAHGQIAELGHSQIDRIADG